jgi:hypothetical protein
MTVGEAFGILVALAVWGTLALMVVYGIWWAISNKRDSRR